MTGNDDTCTEDEFHMLLGIRDPQMSFIYCWGLGKKSQLNSNIIEFI